jgi:peroxiredoxin family protein
VKNNPFAMSFSKFGTTMRITSSYGKTIPEWFRPDLKDKNTLLRHILYRRHLGMNTFVLVLGNVRSGKSWFALKKSELYMEASNQKFDANNQVSFTLIPFLRWSNSNTDSCYLVDEIQLSMGSREWWSNQNRIFNQFCDIQGFRRNCAFFTMPNISYIDKHLRFLINYIVVTVNQGLVRWYKVNARHHIGKFWLDYMGTYRVSKPTKETTNIYEAMKKKYNDQHLKRSIELLEEIQNPQNVKAYEDKRTGRILYKDLDVLR